MDPLGPKADPIGTDLKRRLEAEQARAKSNAAARNTSPAANALNPAAANISTPRTSDEVANLVNSKFGTPFPSESSQPAVVESKPVLSGSLQRRRINAFPTIDTSTTPSNYTGLLSSSSSSSQLLNSPARSGSTPTFASSVSSASNAETSTTSAKDVMGLSKRNEKPLFQTLASASYGGSTESNANSSVSGPGRGLSIEIPPEPVVVTEPIPKQSNNNNDDEKDDESSEEEEDEDEESEEESSSDESSKTKQVTKDKGELIQSPRPPVNDPAALTKAAAMRTLNSANVPIGTKISASGVTSLPGGVPVFQASPRNGAPPGPSLSSLASISGRTDTLAVPTSTASQALGSLGAVPPMLSTSPHGSLTPKGFQCPHCLKRFPQVDIAVHTKSCDLRTELCQYGCGTKVMFIKMHQHTPLCPARVKENARVAAEVRAEAAEAKAEARAAKVSGLGAKVAHSNSDPSDSSDDDDADDFEYDARDKVSNAAPIKPPPVNTLPAAPARIPPNPTFSTTKPIMGITNNKHFADDDVDSSFESSAESDLDALWSMAAPDNTEKAKTALNPSPSVSLISSGRTIPSGLASKSLKPIVDVPESDETMSSSSVMLSSKRSNRLTAKINRSGTMAASLDESQQRSTDKRQANDDDDESS